MSVSASLITRLAAVPGLRYWRHAPLAPFTTIGVGGRADVLVTFDHREAVAEALALLEGEEVPWVILGAGSNLVVADRGFPGVVLKLDSALSYLEGPHQGPRNGVRVVAGAALPLARLATVLAEQGLSGLEWACGIPGTLGGGVAMNAGAHGVELGSLVEAVEVAGKDGIGYVGGGDLAWGYRSCGLPRGSVITAVQLALVPDDRAAILARHRRLLGTRRRTQPRGVRSFGSAFKNPADHSAGRLLDGAGLKGMRRGGAQVSPVHANFVTNLGDATSADVLGLMSMMREAVERRSGFELEPEVRLVGGRFPWEEPVRPGERHGVA